jgi:hypothetical protein
MIALDVGYPPNVANSVVSKIESKVGFHNAMAKLAAESNNVALAILSEFKARGVSGFSNKDLVSALNAIGNAWTRFNTLPKDPSSDNGKNRLRTVILQRVENQTVNAEVQPVSELVLPPEPPQEPEPEF